MKILDILGESVRTERIEQHRGANTLRDLYKQRDKVKRAIRTYTERGDLDSAGELRAELDTILADIKRAEGGITEAKNHMGDREYQSYGSWKAACKKAYPGCTFRGDKDIGAAVLDGRDVGEWDGAVGSVYSASPVSEGFDEEMMSKVKDAIKIGAAKLKEMEEDLSMMDSAAHTEKEYDAVDDFRKDVERQRRVVARLRASLKLRQAANQAGVMD